jgi:hypothetical protein
MSRGVEKSPAPHDGHLSGESYGSGSGLYFGIGRHALFVSTL